MQSGPVAVGPLRSLVLGHPADTGSELAVLDQLGEVNPGLDLLRRGSSGWLAVDDSSKKFLSGFRPRLVNGTAPDIRVRHMLTHTDGFGYSTLLPGDR
jgi:hypothetical protein